MASHIPVGLSVPPRDLTPTTGARTTRLRRPQHCRSSRAPLSIAHESLRPAISCAHDIVASTASRTYVRDDRDTPLVDEAGWRKRCHIILKNRSVIFRGRTG